MKFFENKSFATVLVVLFSIQLFAALNGSTVYAEYLPSNSEYENRPVYNGTLYNYGIWTNGDINLKTGKSRGSSSSVRDSCRTRLEPIKNIVMQSDDHNITLSVCYYNDNNTDSYLGYIKADELQNPVNVLEGLKQFPSAEYIRLLVQCKDGSSIVDIERFIKKIQVYMDINDMCFHDEPQSQGVVNMRKRAYDLINISYKLTADLPAQEGYLFSDKHIPRNTICYGMKYSSTREEQLFVPQAVSLETFASAILNPNSYIYTKRSNSPNSLTYYGAVCSSYVAYCYGIEDVIPTTISFSSFDGFEALPDYQQDPSYAKIGYMLNLKGSHIALITDVIKDVNGEVLAIELSEASHPYMVKRYFTPQEVKEARFDKGYVMYCYRKIDEIPADDNSRFMDICSNMYDSGILNPDLAPRRGDKANWRYGETIEIDLLRPIPYNAFTLCDRNTGVVYYMDLITNDLISIKGLSAGEYSLYLTDGVLESSPVEFNIIKTNEDYCVSGNSVTVTYGSSTGAPSAVLFLNNNDRCSDYRAVRAFHVLTEDEAASGKCVVYKPKLEELEFGDEEYEAPNGVWKMRVVYKTEYGIFSSDIADVSFGQ